MGYQSLPLTRQKQLNTKIRFEPERHVTSGANKCIYQRGFCCRVACLTDDGRRTWGTVEEPAVLHAMMREEFCGRRGRVDGAGKLSVD